MINEFFIPPAYFTDSGHKSCTHRNDLHLNFIDAKMPTKPTVIGDGAKTKTLSKLPRILSNLKHPKNTNEI